MTRSWNTVIVLVMFFTSSFVSNNAAPATKQTESITSTGIGTPEAEITVDEEVLELENLKHPPVTAATPPPVSSGANTKEEILPQLEKQLEEEAQASASITSSDEDDAGSDENDDEGDDDNDDDPDADAENEENNDYAEKLAKASESMLLKTLAEYHHKQQEQQEQQQQIATTDDNSKLMKLLPGAARLTFGQHYSSDSTTTPTIPKSSTTTTTSTVSSQPEEIPNDELELGESAATQSAQRRGDNAEALLRHSGGQYSAFDMAQYVFWTGDEAGVARAVEELIQKGLMTRENAIKFLRDIRLGIDYLQNTYSNRPFKTERHAKTEEHESGGDGSTVGSLAREATTTTVAPPAA